MGSSLIEHEFTRVWVQGTGDSNERFSYSIGNGDLYLFGIDCSRSLKGCPWSRDLHCKIHIGIQRNRTLQSRAKAKSAHSTSTVARYMKRHHSPLKLQIADAGHHPGIPRHTRVRGSQCCKLRRSSSPLRWRPFFMASDIPVHVSAIHDNGPLGFSLLMFMLTLWILLKNRNQNRPNYPMIVAACALQLLAGAVSTAYTICFPLRFEWYS